MEILKIAEALQAYSEDTLAEKTDSYFAYAVSEAVSLLIGQGEKIADLENELKDERYRHDRVQDFEVSEAEELRKARERIRELEGSKCLTVDEILGREDPVWVSCKTLEGTDGYWCLCDKGTIICPSGVSFNIKEIPYWPFYSNKPKEV